VGAPFLATFARKPALSEVKGWDSAAHAVPVVASKDSRSIPKSFNNEEAILRMAAALQCFGENEMAVIVQWSDGAKEEPSVYNLSSFRSQNGKFWLNISPFQNHHCLGEPVLPNRL
jgi:hypothetical protein